MCNCRKKRRVLTPQDVPAPTPATPTASQAVTAGGQPTPVPSPDGH
jgi:hypothetical protein